MALAIHNSCRSPTDQDDSDVCASRPPQSITLSQIFSLCRVATILSSCTWPSGSILNRIDPGIRKDSCGTTLMRERRSDGTISCVSTPSIEIQPSNRIMCNKLNMNDVFPLPERPQMATFSPAAIEIERPFRTGLPPDLRPNQLPGITVGIRQ